MEVLIGLSVSFILGCFAGSAIFFYMEAEEEECHYCCGNCPNEPDDSEYLCDGFAGDIDGLYAEEAN